MIEFEWLEDKAKKNILKHGISFEEASSVFYDYFARISDDSGHSINEERYIIIGNSNLNNLLFVSFTERNNKFRIISARKATRKERKYYEKNNKIY